LHWHFIPTGPAPMFPRNGLTIKAMSEPQRKLALDLLKAGLSQRGYLTATSIMDLETILGALEAAQRAAATQPPRGTPIVRDSERYFFSVFGTPSTKDTWGWRVEGHHVSLHFTVVNGTLVAASPSFFGSNPAEVRQGPKKGLRILGAEEDAARALLESLDALVGRLWTAIRESPLADSTALVLVSDHGMNTDENLYSQGYNLVEWFGSAAGGGHHVITDRHPLTEFKLKGLDPFVSEVITPSRESAYLNGQSAEYPTAVLDPDGNERANIGLRDNALNVVHILLEQLTQKRLPGPVRAAAIDALFDVLNSHRSAWEKRAAELQEDLRSLLQRIEAQAELVSAEPKKWTKEQRELGLDKEARRALDRLDRWKSEARADTEYLAARRRLLALAPADFDPGKFKIEELIRQVKTISVPKITRLEAPAPPQGFTGALQRLTEAVHGGP
jgi:hypothetical protein